MEAADGGGGGSEDDVDEFVAILQLMRLGYMRWLSLLMVDCCRYDITYLLSRCKNECAVGERETKRRRCGEIPFLVSNFIHT